MFATERGDNEAPASRAPVERVEPGRTWVTREGVHVDRMASAWLIGRLIDPEAGIASVIRGIATAQPDDDVRLERGTASFDDRYSNCFLNASCCVRRSDTSFFNSSIPSSSAPIRSESAWTRTVVGSGASNATSPESRCA